MVTPDPDSKHTEMETIRSKLCFHYYWFPINTQFQLLQHKIFLDNSQPLPLAPCNTKIGYYTKRSNSFHSKEEGAPCMETMTHVLLFPEPIIFMQMTETNTCQSLAERCSRSTKQVKIVRIALLFLLHQTSESASNIHSAKCPANVY